MKLLILIFLLLLTSCGSKKKTIQFPSTEFNSEIKKIPSKKNIKHENLNYIDFNNLVLFGNANIQYNNTNYGFDINIRFKKNDKILISGTLILPIFKILIQQDRILGYQKVDRTFFEANFDDVYTKLGIELNFSELENLFLGNPIIDLKRNNNFKIYQNESKMLIYNKEIDNITYNMIFDSNSNKLISQEIAQFESNRYIKIYYDSFEKLKDFHLPSFVGIVINDGNNLIKLTLSNKSKNIDNEISFPFSIPNNYRKIEF